MNKNIRIELSRENDWSIVFDVDGTPDVDLSELAGMFRSLMSAMSFTEYQVNQVINDEI